MSRKKHKKKKKHKYKDIALNIMPFIDVFSLLNTFLLMSAVFLSVGVLEVQIPFLTSAPPPPTKDKDCDVQVDMEKEGIEAKGQNCAGVEASKKFKMDKAGYAELHQYLVAIRKNNPATDKLSFFTEDEVIWKDIAKVLDTIKLRQPGDPVIAPKSNSEIDKALAAEFLFPKVVMASVML